MKRSEINRLIRQAERFFSSMHFALPEWAHWLPERLLRHRAEAAEVFANSLGWDVTDFGGGDFLRRGLLLFTIRNGNPRRDRKPYAEKIMVVRDRQETPMHFHWKKMEDIINRGGADLAMQLYHSTGSGGFSRAPVTVSIDGVARTVAPGGTVVLSAGQSICLPPGVYHRFYGRGGTVMVGEVSMVNDDTADNRFHEPVGRFPEIDEDEHPRRLLVSDYARALRAARGRSHS